MRREKKELYDIKDGGEVVLIASEEILIQDPIILNMRCEAEPVVCNLTCVEYNLLGYSLNEAKKGEEVLIKIKKEILNW